MALTELCNEQNVLLVHDAMYMNLFVLEVSLAEYDCFAFELCDAEPCG